MMILSTPALGSRSKILDLMRIKTVPCKEVWTALCARFYSVKALWDLCNLDVVVFSSCKEATGCQEIYHFALNCWNNRLMLGTAIMWTAVTVTGPCSTLYSDQLENWRLFLSHLISLSNIPKIGSIHRVRSYFSVDYHCLKWHL